MLDAASVDVLTRSLMLGTARQAVPMERVLGGTIAPDDPKATLKALALVGQHSRFRRPAPVSVAAEPLFADSRTTVPETARPLLLSLFSGKSGTVDDVVALAVADAMTRNRFRLHPFDLPRLEEFVKAYGDQLGPSALAWAERHASKAGDDPQDYSFVDTVDDTNWLRAPPAQKAAFISKLRKTDPVRARELVEGIFRSEPAPVRVRLLQALGENLSLADAAFLETLAKDRAPSVRDAAEELLTRVPGSAQAAKRLQDCLGRVKMTKSGLLRRRDALRIEFPATAKDDSQRWYWAVNTFGPIALDAFADAFGLSVDDLVAAVADDKILTRVLAVQAARGRHYELLTRLVRDDPANWVAITWADDPDVFDPPSALAEAAVQPDLWPELPDAVSLHPIYRKLRAPLPEATARRLLASKAWRNFLDHARALQPPPAADTTATIAALTPRSLRAALRADLALLAPDLTARALGALSLLDHIEPV
jgi:Family of unknown function (DUF5691)